MARPSTRAGPLVPVAPRQTPLSRGLWLSALLLVAVVVAMRPLFAGTPADFALTAVTAALLVLAMSLVLISHALDRRLPVVSTPLHAALLLFALAALWGLARGGWQPAAVLRGLDYLSLLLLALLLVELRLELRERQLFLFLALTSFFVVVVYGLYQYFWEFDQMIRDIAQNPARVARELGVSPDDWLGFVDRVEGREVFSTFLMSNSLGGYLVLLLPVLAGYFFDYVRATRGRTERTSSLAYLVMLVAGICALWVSRARGAWLALVAALILGPLLLLAWPRLRRLWPILLLGACIIGGLFCWWLLEADISARVLRNDSVGVRLGFWHGSLRVIGRHPWGGVGIGRFEPYYLQEKLASAHEVDLPHNMWLEAWVEMGIVGLIALVSVMVAALGLALGAARPPATTFQDGLGSAAKPEPPIPRLKPCVYAVVAGVLALSLVRWLASAWSGPLGWALSGLWLATAIFFIYSTPDRLLARAGTGLRWGLVLGLVAFLVHGSADIDLYAPGITTALVVLLAGVVWEPRGTVRRVRLSGRAALALGALALVATIGYARGLARPLIEVQGEKELAKQSLSAGDHETAVRRLERALGWWPNDLEALHQLAGIHSGRAARPGGTEKEFRRAEDLWRRVITLRPESFQGYYQLARLYRSRAAQMGPAAGTARARSLLEQAEHQYGQALTRYPTWPLLRMELGTLYEALGRGDRADREYVEALRLTRLMTQNTRKLTPEQQAELRERLERLGTDEGGDAGG